MEKRQQVFLELVRAGLWGKEVRLVIYGGIDFREVYRLAQEQSVVGLVAAGLEHAKDVKVPQELALAIAGEVLQLEQRNRAMNQFVARLIEEMRGAEIYTILVKGQGIAQCYERPLWRSSGDIDFLLSEENYKKASLFLKSKASHIEQEDLYERHIGMVINSWVVELHGSLHAGISSRIDEGIDEAQSDVFYGGQVRLWQNGGTQIFLPSVDDDIIFVFTHILKHFYKGGVGLRQICDWCRLLMVYQGSINVELLEKRIHKMRIMAEWKSFAMLAVNSLGMPSDAIPFYSSDAKWAKKADRIIHIILEAGNMGHNKDLSYQKRFNLVRRKIYTFSILSKEAVRNFSLFPVNTLLAWKNVFRRGLCSLL